FFFFFRKKDGILDYVASRVLGAVYTKKAIIQTEVNKLRLECVVQTQSSVAKILGIESLSPHVSGNPKFEYANMVEDIREKVSSEMERFFPKNDDE
ncbi:relaxosome protein TraM, partial [Escherichia coli]|uniref:relaxosome protein TraM n=1 Tax=Escherichia coli TaxID=562 RepID=UPI00258BC682